MGGSGHWAGLELQAGLRHADDLAAAEHRRMLRTAGVGRRGARKMLMRALAAAGASVTRLLTSRRRAEVPASVDTVARPAEGVLLD